MSKMSEEFIDLIRKYKHTIMFVWVYHQTSFVIFRNLKFMTSMNRRAKNYIIYSFIHKLHQICLV